MNRKRVNILVFIFICWMLVQFVRAAFMRGEPYPAVYYPGFSHAGKSDIYNHKLLYKKDEIWINLSYKDCSMGFPRYAKMLSSIHKESTTSDISYQPSEATLQKLSTLKKISDGDSIRLKTYIVTTQKGVIQDSLAHTVKFIYAID